MRPSPDTNSHFDMVPLSEDQPDTSPRSVEVPVARAGRETMLSLVRALARSAARELAGRGDQIPNLESRT